MTSNTEKFLLSPLFLIGLFVLILNDFVLKAHFGNFVTGKLSDFAGLFIFPYFFAIFKFKYRFSIYMSTAVLFVLWKSTFSQPAIDLVNSSQPFKFGRTVDYGDLIALIVLPLSYKYLENISSQSVATISFVKKCLSAFVILVSCFAFTATSFKEDRNVIMSRNYSINLTKNAFVRKLRENRSVGEIEIEKKTDVFPPERFPDVKADPNAYYARFIISQPYCESQDIRVFGSFVEQEGKISIDYLSFNFWCKDEPTKADEDKLRSIFEENVIRHLENGL